MSARPQYDKFCDSFPDGLQTSWEAIFREWKAQLLDISEQSFGLESPGSYPEWTHVGLLGTAMVRAKPACQVVLERPVYRAGRDTGRLDLMAWVDDTEFEYAIEAKPVRCPPVGRNSAGRKARDLLVDEAKKAQDIAGGSFSQHVAGAVFVTQTRALERDPMSEEEQDRCLESIWEEVLGGRSLVPVGNAYAAMSAVVFPGAEGPVQGEPEESRICDMVSVAILGWASSPD